MQIGIDVDGVLLDFEKELRTRAELYDLLDLNGKGILYTNYGNNYQIILLILYI